jgi:hypothetical protein
MARKRNSIEETQVDKDVFDEQVAADQATEAAGVSRAAAGKKQYPPVADPFQVAHDNLAGAKLLESRRRRELLLVFDAKPSPEVIAKVKEHGFRWNNTEKLWVRKIAHEAANQDRLEGHRAYRSVVSMIRTERGHQSAAELGASY